MESQGPPAKPISPPGAERTKWLVFGLSFVNAPLFFVLLAQGVTHAGAVLALGTFMMAAQLEQFRLDEKPWYKSTFLGWVALNVLVLAWFIIGFFVVPPKAMTIEIWAGLAAVLGLYALCAVLVIRQTIRNTDFERERREAEKSYYDEALNVEPISGPG